MSRTRKDAPYRVKAARTGNLDDHHFGCKKAPEHTRRRSPARWEEHTEVVPPRWHLRTVTIPHPIYGDFLSKKVTMWVFDEEVITEQVPVFEDIDCDTGPKSWCEPTIPWHLNNNGHGSGLRRGRVSRAGDRDLLRVTAREYNTYFDLDDDAPAPVPGRCRKNCRRYSCWWCN